MESAELEEYFSAHQDRMEAALSAAVSGAMELRDPDPIRGLVRALLQLESRNVDVQQSVEDLRHLLVRCHGATSTARDAIEQRLLSQAGVSSTRSNYLRTLDSQIGPRPATKTWQDEWIELSVEHFRMTDARVKCTDGTKRDVTTMSDAELTEHVRMVDNVAQYIAWVKPKNMAWSLEHGWSHSNAITYGLLFQRRAPIALALREGSRRFAASTHALCDCLYEMAHHQQSTVSAAAAATTQRPFYANLRGTRKNGRQLLLSDPRWANLEVADRNGFRGLTCSSLTRFFDEDDMWDATGICVPEWSEVDGSCRMAPQDSDVLMVETSPPDDAGFHAPVQVTPGEFAFPPNTLFSLKRVEESFTAPTGVTVRQRLLTVSATYRAPRRLDGEADASSGSKLCAPASLAYADRSAYIDGLDDILIAPSLSMEMEFDRDKAWADWKGVHYTLRGEWAYATGPAHSAECTPGVRDRNNVSKKPRDFMAEVNAHILSRRAEGSCRHELPDAHAQLTEEEVIAVRLYSGPAYQPINAFLRAIANCTGEFRRVMARDPSLTFSATTGHIVRAIRKLADVSTPQEAAAPLYRGVRGELPKRFWLRDDSGLVCATDTAFMSTSLQRSTPIDYMGNNEFNVLWELVPSEQDDTGYHRGADISMLSQFAAEAECLFPPCTMLQVLEIDGTAQRHESGADAHSKAPDGLEDARGLRVSQEASGDKSFIAIKVRPSFV